MIRTIGVIGAGGWGTAVAKVLCEKGLDTTLWCRGEDTYDQIRKTGENSIYLPQVSLPRSLRVTRSLKEALGGKGFVLCMVPSHGVREVMERAAPHVDAHAIVVCGTKGIEEGTLMTMGEVFTEVLGSSRKDRLTFLSGPTFALEVARGLPTAVTVAAWSDEVAREVQEIFSTPNLRVYTSRDVIGVQMGGAIKNVIAIAAGISDGLDLGANARAALVTRGLAEMTRLTVKMGADPVTLSGLPGLGDLLLTCTGDLSRNRKIGLEIGRGKNIKDTVGKMRMVAEGVRNTRALYLLARKLDVETPIIDQMYLVLYEGKMPREAVRDLMQRSLKPENI